jgi:hypothetical protein
LFDLYIFCGLAFRKTIALLHELLGYQYIFFARLDSEIENKCAFKFMLRQSCGVLLGVFVEYRYEEFIVMLLLGWLNL